MSRRIDQPRLPHRAWHADRLRGLEALSAHDHAPAVTVVRTQIPVASVREPQQAVRVADEDRSAEAVLTGAKLTPLGLEVFAAVGAFHSAGSLARAMWATAERKAAA